MPVIDSKIKPAARLYPLKLFYELKGLALPEISEVPGDEIPFPARELLVHQEDMTSQLVRYFGSEIYIKPHLKEIHGEMLDREVVLHLKLNDRPVEYGAIQIDASKIPGVYKKQVLECKKPLGAILRESGIYYISSPTNFFRVQSDIVMKTAFGLHRIYPLYGRCNILRYDDGHILADVVEILPPIEYLLKPR